MIRVVIWVCLLVFSPLVYGQQDMNRLLSLLKSESQISGITKSESAGFVDIYTREDIEKMQAQTLWDILKLFTIPNVSRSALNISYYTKPSNHQMPHYAIRLYINDHDFSTGSYGSDAVLWSNITLDEIDHIVVYKSTSSIEFGNEPSTVVIKLYTKKAEKEEGGRFKVSVDQKGSYHVGSYYAHTTRNDLSYLLYMNKNDIQRKSYDNDGYKIDSDNNSENLYGNIYYKDWRFEAGHFTYETGSFVGMGRQAHPYGDGFYGSHCYVHVTKMFDNDFKLQIAYDTTTYNVDYRDESGIFAGGAGYVTNYLFSTNDKVTSIIGEKIIKSGKNKLLLGGFLKIKNTKTEGEFDTTYTDFKNSLSLYSLYAEDSYSFDPTLMLVASLKGDFYRYNKVVKSQNEYIARVGLIKNIHRFQLKTFYTRTYYQIPMTYLYSTNDTPYITNPDLNYTTPGLLTMGVRYKDSHHEFDVRAGFISVKKKLLYNDSGFYEKSMSYDQYEFKYTYTHDYQNRITIDAYTGNNSINKEFTPRYGGHLILFNSYGKFDFYNQLSYRSDYSVGDVTVDASIDYSFAYKYHLSADLSIGIKGENIFNTGYEQIYENLDRAIPVYDRKFWLSMEYLF